VLRSVWVFMDVSIYRDKKVVVCAFSYPIKSSSLLAHYICVPVKISTFLTATRRSDNAIEEYYDKCYQAVAFPNCESATNETTEDNRMIAMIMVCSTICKRWALRTICQYSQTLWTVCLRCIAYFFEPSSR
jgi:hypothetical protein